MEVNVITEQGHSALEGVPEQPMLTTVDDLNRLIEACWFHEVDAMILYAPNLTPRFFDLSSGEAGAILQKLQNYQIRLGVVLPPGTVALSSRFGDVLAENRHSRAFGVFASRGEALGWLTQA
jgi:Domain of unknown function (DUF4180)